MCIRPDDSGTIAVSVTGVCPDANRRLTVVGRVAPYRTRPPLPVAPDTVTVTATDPTPVEGTPPTPATRTVIVRPACSAPWWLPPAPVRVSTTRDCSDKATYVPGTPL